VLQRRKGGNFFFLSAGAAKNFLPGPSLEFLVSSDNFTFYSSPQVLRKPRLDTDIRLSWTPCDIMRSLTEEETKTCVFNLSTCALADRTGLQTILQARRLLRS
jgi:hypothetical protein